MSARHSIGAGPGIGDRVSLTHDASGSVLHGTVQLCPTVGLVVDVDGRVFDMDRTGWHVSQADVEPPSGSVVIDRDGDAWQRQDDLWRSPDADLRPRPWTHVMHLGPLEVIWEPSR